MRFLLVSFVAEVVSLLLLTLFVEGAGLAKVPAQTLAVACSMPLNFLGNKLWSFRPASPAIARRSRCVQTGPDALGAPGRVPIL